MTEKIQSIPARIKNIAKGGHVAGVEDIIDDVSGKTQKEINAATSEEIAEIKGGSTDSIATLNQKIATEQGRAQDVEQGLNSRLSTIEGLADISIDGGSIGIATSDDFVNPTSEQRAKVPTVGAILDNTDETPIKGSEKFVKSDGVAKSLEKIDYLKAIINKIEEIGFYIVDSRGQVCLKYTEDGFDTAKLSEHFKELVKGIDGTGINYRVISNIN
jgi:hypothetical protein